MKPPRSITVGPHTYKITTDRDAIARASHKNGGAVYGITDKVALKITIDPDQARSQMADTVLHECLHCLADLTYLDMTEEVEEALVRRLSPALLDLLRRNPKLTAWLMEE